MLICNSLVEKKIHYPKDLGILPGCVQMNSSKSLHEKKRVRLTQEMKSGRVSATDLLGDEIGSIFPISSGPLHRPVRWQAIPTGESLWQGYTLSGVITPTSSIVP